MFPIFVILLCDWLLSNSSRKITNQHKKNANFRLVKIFKYVKFHANEINLNIITL